MRSPPPSTHESPLEIFTTPYTSLTPEGEYEPIFFENSLFRPSFDPNHDPDLGNINSIIKEYELKESSPLRMPRVFLNRPTSPSRETPSPTPSYVWWEKYHIPPFDYEKPSCVKSTENCNKKYCSKLNYCGLWCEGPPSETTWLWVDETPFHVSKEKRKKTKRKHNTWQGPFSPKNINLLLNPRTVIL